MRSKARLDCWTVRVCVCADNNGAEQLGLSRTQVEKERKRNMATIFCISTVVSHCICTAKYSDKNNLVPDFNTGQLVSFLNRRATHNPPPLTVVLRCDWLQQLFINFRTGLIGFVFSSPDTCPEVTLCHY